MSYFENSDIAHADRNGLPLDEALVNCLEDLDKDLMTMYSRGNLTEDRYRAIHGYLSLTIAEIIRPGPAEGEPLWRKR